MRWRDCGDGDVPAHVRTEQVDAPREIVPPVLWRAFVLVWLLFLYYPLLTLWLSHPAPFPLVMTLVGTAIFAALYLSLALPLPFGAAAPSRLSQRTHLAPLVLTALLVTDISLLALLASADWLWFFIFASIALGARLPPWPAAVAVAVVTALAVVVGVGPFGWVYALRIALPVAVVGFGVIGVGWFVATIRALRAAREEIARLAVAEERLRFARDLHDLLGHSLSAITLKNEVARSLIPTHPDRAVRELGDSIGLAREALREVRQAVSGYRQPTLAVELHGARELLDAAGIACTVDDGSTDASGSSMGGAPALPLPSVLEAVLAWTVREGVTNVVRHSSAHHCAITLQRQGDGETVVVEITDDGQGGTGARTDISTSTGSGLRGLVERATQVHGQVEAGPREPAGFRLRVSIPLPAAPATASDTKLADASTNHPTEERVTLP